MDVYNANAKQQASGQKTSLSNGAGSSAESTQNINKVGYNNVGSNNKDTKRPR